jgi:hypothetical protein
MRRGEFSCVECGGPSRVTALPIRTTQQPNLHEHSPDLRKESRKRMFGFFGERCGAGRGERSEANRRRQPGPAASVRLPSAAPIAGPAGRALHSCAERTPW